jgi:hypothetical protein
MANPSSTVPVQNVELVFTQDCGCKQFDEDDCLHLVSVVDLVDSGVPICEQCGEQYKLDDNAIISQTVLDIGK